jgi:amino acid permease
MNTQSLTSKSVLKHSLISCALSIIVVVSFAIAEYSAGVSDAGLGVLVAPIAGIFSLILSETLGQSIISFQKRGHLTYRLLALGLIYSPLILIILWAVLNA